MITVQNLEAFYGDFQALFGIDFSMREGESVAIIGANGAGKSTFLKSICGQIKVGTQAISFAGRPIGGVHPSDIVAMGIAMVPEGRRLFPSLSVEENLLVGRMSKRSGAWNLQRVYELFPALVEKRKNPALTLSGGQQQMVAIGRALMSNPKLLICDEISLGLAPVVVKDIYQALPKITGDGTSALIVEQDIDTAKRMTDRLYCFMHGKVALTGKSAELSKKQISDAYFGI
jgi:branched-chain amino acid transport system ATP-binding protein